MNGEVLEILDMLWRACSGRLSEEISTFSTVGTLVELSYGRWQEQDETADWRWSHSSKSYGDDTQSPETSDTDFTRSYIEKGVIQNYNTKSLQFLQKVLSLFWLDHFTTIPTVQWWGKEVSRWWFRLWTFNFNCLHVLHVFSSALYSDFFSIYQIKTTFFSVKSPKIQI